MGYFKQGNVELAKHKLLLALQQAPRDPMVLDAMGYYLEQTGNASLAEDYYLKAIKFSSSGATQNNYGVFLCRERCYADAIAHFLLAAKDLNYMHPATAYANAATCAFKIPNPQLARTYLQKAKQNDPNFQTALFELKKVGYNLHR
jgi:type IV pilus assembly protein PilF